MVVNMLVNSSNPQASNLLRPNLPRLTGLLSSLVALSLLATPVFAAPGNPSAKVFTGAQVSKTDKVEKPAAKADKAEKPAAKTDKPAENKESKDSAKAPEKAAEKKESKPAPEPVIENVQAVQAETLVEHPNDYLNKNVRFVANFWAYSTLALDYKPAMRKSKDYLSFLILRQNSKVPLSELKLAMPMPKDDKDPQSKLLTELKEGDQLEITGKVFALALDEPWVDVLKLKRLKAAADDKKDDKKDKADAPAK